MTRLIARLFPWWPRYRVAPPLAYPHYLRAYLHSRRGREWGW